ncbi:unnamed protein product [Bursaphelenchus xylophilus]|uniref:(pine wood nematode) hypothetical protein n=1 Tax=Bursaphelenchus xylophilus TaxID=6326 RepID=A0A1I7SL34_BURXY|nr:unnamed protein product [Bursaphelenchus xylophilus]CAG9129353.1 unnamed protein product [Bursaphelenchus xylophilus]
MVGFNLSLLFVFMSMYFFQVGAILPSTYKVTANGTFTCEGRKLFGQTKVRVEIWEKDPLKDDLLAKGIVGVDGGYDFTGSEAEYFGISPYVYVYHACGGKCRRIKFEGSHVNPGNYELKDKGQSSDKCSAGKYPRYRK